MRKKFILWIALILWCSLIFFFSAQVAKDSAELSSGLTETILKWLYKLKNMSFPVFKSINIHNFELFFGYLENIVRKCAHFGIYSVLGIISLSLASCYFALNLKSLLLSFAFCVFYASTDEFHQLFVPGRGGNITDVGIDSAGALLGILITAFFIYIVQTRKKRKAA